ncbi:VOC family protein [Actinopolymorpha alba]|uniref:VOC family protein n=1 Tax=Actinopolymorpha alba TaxID=533267 RepID=UPI00036518E8|nr:VOC family protein [Actinopolymorpha alba]
MALGPLAQVHISVTDIDRAVAFYRDVLEIPFLFQVPNQPMAFFQTGEVRLYLGTPESPEFTTRVMLYFSVDDLDAEYARLAGRGVSFLDEPHVVHRNDEGELWMAFFRDPDGNNLALTALRPTGSPAP